jgi:DNA-binding beta-propeller fold protein YncE
VRPAEVLDLAAFGLTIPHMITFGPGGSHAIISDAGTGRVAILRAADRQLVWSEIVGDHVHHADATPSGRAILAADTGHRALVEILADFGRESFAIGRSLDLGALEDGVELVNNAPICFAFSSDGGKAYVTLRGGGLAIIDVEALEVLRTYGRSTIAAAGCGAVRTPDGRYVLLNSGTATSGAFYVLDAATDELVASVPLTPYGRDAHGLAILATWGVVWNVNTVDDNGVALDLDTWSVVAVLPFVGDAPDLLVVAPSETTVFVTLRGPNPLTRAPHAAGSTPGIAVLRVVSGARGALVLGVLPLGSPSEIADSDPHGIAVRVLRR